MTVPLRHWASSMQQQQQPATAVRRVLQSVTVKPSGERCRALHVCLCGSCNAAGPSKQSSLICASGPFTQTEGAASSSVHLSQGGWRHRGSPKTWGGKSERRITVGLKKRKRKAGPEETVGGNLKCDVIRRDSRAIASRFHNNIEMANFRQFTTANELQWRSMWRQLQYLMNFFFFSSRIWPQAYIFIFTSCSLSGSTGKAVCFLCPPVDSVAKKLRFYYDMDTLVCCVSRRRRCSLEKTGGEC